MKALLKAQADLLWFGASAPYVKASAQTSAEAGDGPMMRFWVNGADIRAKVVGEAPIWAARQLGRVKYAQGGGRINTMPR